MDLSLLRARTGRVLLGLLWLLVPLTGVVAMLEGHVLSEALTGTALALGVALAATFAARRGTGMPEARYAISVALMAAISVHVWLAPDWLTIDIHMAYFAGLALLAGFVDWRAILLGAATVAVHHLVLNFAAPVLVFGVDEGNLGRVLLHAVILVIEAVALMWMVRELESAAVAATDALAEARAAREAEAAQAARRIALEAEAAAAARTARHGIAAEVEGSIGRIAGGVQDASGNLDAAARRIAASAGEGASEAEAARAAVAEASAGVQTVAAAAEELSTAVAEITRQVAQASAVARNAADRADATGDIVRGLSEGAARIGDVVRLIGEIAGQTNLLALNATIEAARAGEAGKGFAVVASEVKALASQTAKATEEIGQQVGAIQAATGGAVDAIRDIAVVVAEVNQVAATIAAAVEEQGAATREIASATAGVARGTEAASGAVVRAADRMGGTAAAVGELERMAEALRGDAGALREALATTVAGLRAA
ncbi:methyl-accepting chemotaxis protein [Neoroseomonas nitratireducens]|nr:methyl-accepting chemotaxis protein [Neoroseomonas nitratireducens]